jgi:hypothetical protein
MTRAGRGKVPTIWAVVCTDTDGTKIVFEMHSSRNQAALGAKHWRENERKGRWYRIVRYEAAKARTASRKGGK